MSTTPTAASPSIWQQWKTFWFAPMDPTVLGFMRITTGLLVLYIHLTYSLDLQAFFGKYGWYSADRVERERKEYPFHVGSLTDWDENASAVRLPEFPHRREAVLAFIRGLPETAAERDRALRFLTRVSNDPVNDQTRLALRYVQGLSSIESEMEAQLAVYVAGPDNDGAKGPKPTVAWFAPDVLQHLPPSTREQIAGEIRSFWKVLPKDRGGISLDRQYVFNHLTEMDPPARQSFVGFLTSLPDDPVRRNELITFVEYWNNDPRRAYRTGHSIVSVWFHVTDPTQMAVIHGLILGVMVLFTVGFCTRVTSVLTWLAAVGYIHRTQQILFGMDTMMNILLLYLMIGNSGAAMSVDRLIARYRAARASLRRTGTIDAPTRAFLDRPPPSASAGFAVRLVQVHFCFIYLAAGLSKLKGPGWWTGEAFWGVMINPEFTLLRYEWFEQMARALASVKPLYYAITTGGVWFTLFLEIGFPFLVWTRLRPLMVWLAVLLHAAIGVLMGLNLFELLMLVMLLVYIPSPVIRDRLRGGPGLPRFSLGFNPADGTNCRTAAAVLAVDSDTQVTIEPRKNAASPVVTAPGGSPLTGSAAVSALFANMRLLRPVRWVLWVPGVSGLLAKVLFPTPPTANGSRALGGPKTPMAAS